MHARWHHGFQAQIPSLCLARAACRGVTVTRGLHKLLVCIALLLPSLVVVECELVQRAGSNGLSASMEWSQAGADFEQHITHACADNVVFDAVNESFEQCASAYRELFLAADLKLWNAIDGRNLTWEQRPLRVIPEHLVDQFAMGGRVQLLRSYRSDAQSPSLAFSSDDISALVDRARAREPGAAYPQVDRLLYSSNTPCIPIAGETLIVSCSGGRW